MKLIYICPEKNNGRKLILFKGLVQNDIEVVEIIPNYKSKLFNHFYIIVKFIFTPKSDVDGIVIGFFGHLLVPIIRLLTVKPIFFDMFISIYDTVYMDRNLVKNGLLAESLYFFDKLACTCSDRIILDTNADIDFFHKFLKVQIVKFHRIFVGSDNSIFYPKNRSQNCTVTVYYNSSYLPLHGVEYIVKAANILQSNSQIKFKITGHGMEFDKVYKLSQTLETTNIEFNPNIVNIGEIADEIVDSDICLAGHFSENEKAKRTIPGKSYDFIASRRPIIVTDNPANRELFRNGYNALIIKHGNENELADAIQMLANNPPLRESIANNGYKTYCEFCTPAQLGKELKQMILDYIGEK